MGGQAYAQSSLPPSPGYQSHSFQYVTGVLTSSNLTSNVANAFNSITPPKYYSLAVATTGAGFLVKLEGSLDNQNWQQLASTNTASGITSVSVPAPMLYIRLRGNPIPANVSVTATAIGEW